jgi:hypothetical protein
MVGCRRVGAVYLCDLLAQHVFLLVEIMDVHICECPHVDFTQEADAIDTEQGAH